MDVKEGVTVSDYGNGEQPPLKGPGDIPDELGREETLILSNVSIISLFKRQD